jgi:NADH-quinone oxidoreductase subunit A
MSIIYFEYYNIFVTINLALVVALVILFLSLRLSEYKPDVEKLSAYECGFDPYEDARNAFDIRFYLVALIFILFDLEAVFFFPWCCSLSFLNLDGVFLMVDFLVELLVGFVYAWLVGALDWEKN